MIVIRQIICGIHVEHCDTIFGRDCNGTRHIINHINNGRIVAAGNGDSDLLIDTFATLVGNGDGIGLG